MINVEPDHNGRHLVYLVVEKRPAFDGLNALVYIHGAYTDYFDAQARLRAEMERHGVKPSFENARFFTTATYLHEEFSVEDC